MDLLQQNDKVLLLWDQSFDLQESGFDAEKLKTELNVSIKFENVERLALASYENSHFNLIILKVNHENSIEFLATLLKLLKPKGRLFLSGQNVDAITENLKLAGFVKIDVKHNDIVAEKANYEVGSAAKLSFAKKTTAPNKESIAAVWKLANDDDEEDEMINADDLLDEEDKIKPDPSQLKVCGTTGKRKACKDCSCGLAEELTSENGTAAKTNDTAKSSCGSCYLGDAFRCASCPYLGMPAFKPGEKIQLAGGLLKDDI